MAVIMCDQVHQPTVHQNTNSCHCCRQNGITSIEEDSFEVVKNLDYLNISHNTLRELRCYHTY